MGIKYMATNRGEEGEQARVLRGSHLATVRALAPQLRWLHHSPNGGKRDGFTGAQMKALGVKPGFPDLILPVAADGMFGQRRPGLAIEMKSATGVMSDLQKEWRVHLRDEQGWLYEVARSAPEARLILCGYLGFNSDDMPALP